MALLHPGDTFPHLTVELTDGSTLSLPGAFRGRWGVVLFNRGAWCPYCQTQLRAFQRALPALTEAGATVVSLSVDDRETAHGLVDKYGLSFPVGHSADAPALAEATGAFVNADPPYVQATGFVLDPDGRVVVSVYSSGAIGRLVPEDVRGLITYLGHQAG